MRSLLLICFFWLSFCSLKNVYSAENIIIEVVTEKGGISGSALYQKIVALERSRGNSVRIFKAVEWKYISNSGQFLLVNIKSPTTNSCVIYQLRSNYYLSLGGNTNCTWVKHPHLIWQGDSAWIEFPKEIRSPEKIPITHADVTIHFNNATGNICAIGLPHEGYSDLRCPEDEAPKSR